MIDESFRVTLINSLQELQKYAECHHSWNYYVWAVLVTISLILVAVTSYLALSKPSKLVGVLSILTGVVISFQTAFAFGDAAQFYRAMAAQSKALIFKAQTTKDEAKLEMVSEQYQQLLNSLGRDLPVGKGMSVVPEISAKN